MLDESGINFKALGLMSKLRHENVLMITINKKKVILTSSNANEDTLESELFIDGVPATYAQVKAKLEESDEGKK